LSKNYAIRFFVNAAALLGLSAREKTIQEFCLSEDVQLSLAIEPAQNHDAALIFGGDGTVHRHLAQLHRYKIPTLVVPTGSGNDFAKSLGIRNVEIALRAWQQFCVDGSNVKEIDLGLIRAGGEEILFCCVAGVGMDAEANARANRMPQWLKSRGGYVLAALQSLVAFKPVEMSVKTAQREIRRPAFFVAVGNAHRYGGGMKVTPRALPDDGLLDICVVSKLNKLKLLCWVPTIFFGGHLRLKQVEYFQAERVRIETGRELGLYADGDFACKTPVEIGVVRKALRVIMPSESELARQRGT
jgi:diacylglycerol kinase (ATP)